MLEAVDQVRLDVGQRRVVELLHVALPDQALAFVRRAEVRRVDERIEELQRLRIGLTECIGCGCLSLTTCALNNPLDELATLGPGPHRLDP